MLRAGNARRGAALVQGGVERGTIEIAGAMVAGENHLDATIKGCLKGLELIETAINDGMLKSSERENEWIPKIRDELESIPGNENDFADEMAPLLAERYLPEEYGM